MKNIIVKQMQLQPYEVIQQLFESSSVHDVKKFLDALLEGVEHIKINEVGLKIKDLLPGDIFLAFGYGQPLLIIRPNDQHRVFLIEVVK